jgi:hypothetical protein
LPEVSKPVYADWGGEQTAAETRYSVDGRLLRVVYTVRATLSFGVSTKKIHQKPLFSSNGVTFFVGK